MSIIQSIIQLERSNKQQRKEEYMNVKKIATIILLLCLIMGILTTSVGAIIDHEHNDWEEVDCMNTFCTYRFDDCRWEGQYGGGVNHPYGCRVQVAVYYTLVLCRQCGFTFGPFDEFVHDCSALHTRTFLITHPCPY